MGKRERASAANEYLTQLFRQKGVFSDAQQVVRVDWSLSQPGFVEVTYETSSTNARPKADFRLVQTSFDPSKDSVSVYEQGVLNAVAANWDATV